MTTQPETDMAQIRRALAGDQQGYANLYDQYAAGLYRLCYSLLLNRQDAEDVSQEAFVYAFKNLKRYDPDRASFKTWLYTIAVSRCRNVYRRKRPVLVDLSQLLGWALPAPHAERPEAQLTHQHAREAVSKALLSLSPRLREAVILRYGHGMTYREIAAVMNCPPKTAESRVRLAHEQLRGLLQVEGRSLLDELLSY